MSTADGFPHGVVGPAYRLVAVSRLNVACPVHREVLQSFVLDAQSRVTLDGNARGVTWFEEYVTPDAIAPEVKRAALSEGFQLAVTDPQGRAQHMRFTFRCPAPGCRYEPQVVAAPLMEKVRRYLEGLAQAGLSVATIVNVDRDWKTIPTV